MTKQSQLILLCLVLGVHSIVLIGYRQPLLRQPAETEARKDSPVIMLTELQQTLELTSHAMVRDPKLLVRVHEHGYGAGLEKYFPDHQPSFHGARRHQQPGGTQERLGTPFIRLDQAIFQVHRSLAGPAQSNIKLQPKHSNLDTFLHSDVLQRFH